MTEFYASMRALETRVGEFQQSLVFSRILCTPAMVAALRLEASESEIVNCLTSDTLKLQPDGEEKLLLIREATLALLRNAESIVLAATFHSNLPETKRVLLTTEFLTLIETVDIMLGRFLGNEKCVERKFGPHLAQLLHHH